MPIKPRRLCSDFRLDTLLPIFQIKLSASDCKGGVKIADGIFIGLGSNLPWSGARTPQAVLDTALADLATGGAVTVRKRSRWYRSPPYPASPQPWFVNGVIEVSTRLSIDVLMQQLLAVEARFGRTRGERNAARTLDLDLLAYGDIVSAPGAAVVVPHPRLHERAFVLAPLCDVAPAWRHPRLARTAAELLAALPPSQIALPIEDDGERPTKA